MATATATKLCRPCGRELSRESFPKRSNRAGGIGSACRECQTALERQSYRNLRNAVLQKYGGCCAVCSDDRLVALDIDHIDEQGHKERQAVKQDHKWLRGLRDGPIRPDLQILCGSCHNIKTRGGDPVALRKG